MEKNLSLQLNKKVLIIALAVATLLCLVTVLLFRLTQPGSLDTVATAQILVISAPTDTPTPLPTAVAQEMTQEVINGISIGALIAIDGTGGAGLRIRAGASTSEAVSFVAEDGDRFEVTDGPIERDGYVWWLLAAENAPERSGWAVSEYLVSILP